MTEVIPLAIASASTFLWSVFTLNAWFAIVANFLIVGPLWYAIFGNYVSADQIFYEYFTVILGGGLIGLIFNLRSGNRALLRWFEAGTVGRTIGYFFLVSVMAFAPALPWMLIEDTSRTTAAWVTAAVFVVVYLVFAAIVIFADKTTYPSGNDLKSRSHAHQQRVTFAFWTFVLGFIALVAPYWVWYLADSSFDVATSTTPFYVQLGCIGLAVIIFLIMEFGITTGERQVAKRQGYAQVPMTHQAAYPTGHATHRVQGQGYNA